METEKCGISKIFFQMGFKRDNLTKKIPLNRMTEQEFEIDLCLRLSKTTSTYDRHPYGSLPARLLYSKIKNGKYPTLPLTPRPSSFPIPHARCGKKISDLFKSLDFFLLTH
jgi:hypothetical protein